MRFVNPTLAFLACIISHASSASVVTSLPQSSTNGNSKWGMIDTPHLPSYLMNDISSHTQLFNSSPISSGLKSDSSEEPWGLRKTQMNDPYSDPPVTGVTRYYEFDVRRGILSPDGYQKHGIFVNNQFPGPAIEANWGDWIEVYVHNNIQDGLNATAEGTAIHFHGITQKGTPWSDGVPGFTQCPIAPGSSFRYRFRANVYGTSWWHSHFSAQYTAGAWGPMIIYGPRHARYDIDLGPVMVGDYYHGDYHDVADAAVSNSTDFNVYVPWSDNSLINGKNNYNCTMAPKDANATCHFNAGLAQFRFQPGKVHRLRLVNTGAAALIHFSIDGHRMEVIANDFDPVVPYNVDFVTLHVGQRTDILVTADADPRATYWMRSTISLNCSVTYTTEARAIISYEGNHDIQIPKSKISEAAALADQTSFLCQNDALERSVPFYPRAVETPDTVKTITVDLFTNATGSHVWTMNNVTEYTDYTNPLLLQVSKRGAPYNSSSLLQKNGHSNLYDFGTNKTVRIVLNTVYQSAHPMHLHGHNFQVLAEGPGPWDGKTIINSHNPLRRDTHIQRRYGHLVIQFTLDNPGIWTYHCHIAWHAAMGLNIGILERPTELVSSRTAQIVSETCDSWHRWTKTHAVNQVDAGI
ncbi:multicopper oxidase [Nemania sp. FL0916]|nr:multicopper oxidase [Nemania sp. FL0916]